MQKQKNGRYIAKCKERSLIQAGLNGHSAVFPEALLEIRGSDAVFMKDDDVVRQCKSAYALTHFDIQPILETEA